MQQELKRVAKIGATALLVELQDWAESLVESKIAGRTELIFSHTGIYQHSICFLHLYSFPIIRSLSFPIFCWVCNSSGNAVTASFSLASCPMLFFALVNCRKLSGLNMKRTEEGEEGEEASFCVFSSERASRRIGDVCKGQGRNDTMKRKMRVGKKWQFTIRLV